MRTPTITIGHLYPREMNIYGDMGNVLTLRQRLAWRNIKTEVVPIEPHARVNWSDIDLVFGGGGQDSGQVIMSQDLSRHGVELKKMAADGVPMLVICGSYQLFGHGFTTSAGQELAGISIFGAHTRGSDQRMIGNVLIDSQRFGNLIGFENHSGQTILEQDQQALGTVIQGYGNDGAGRAEGALYNNVVGTYLHGPVLPKNPRFADDLLVQALNHRGVSVAFDHLDDSLEMAAARLATTRPR
jgi:CobQ-like glutamine amidotransferase family enzyme